MKAAIYSRFSTDRQSESSIRDQVRICTELATCEGFRVTQEFTDEGISGAAIGNRPDFLRMMAAAHAGSFNVLLVMDVSRLSRSQGDLAKTIDRLVFLGVRVLGVHDGFDSAREGHELVSGLSGIIGQQFRSMVSKKTHAALESRAHRGEKTGGQAYGYREGEAEIVRTIFAWYIEGRSSKWIATELNSRDVSSPGSHHNRTKRRAKGWCPSAIHGDSDRGIGILNNELYIGRDIWNRTKWTKNPDTGKRKNTPRPQSEWIITDVPEMRLISDDDWRRVKARQARRRQEIGDVISSGKKKSLGRGPRYLLSTLMKCADCGGNYVMANAHMYGCSRYINGRACANNAFLNRIELERKILSEVRDCLLSPEIEREFTERARRALLKPDATAGRRKELEAEIARMIDAIAHGIRSSGLKARLEGAETELEDLARLSTVVDPKRCGRPCRGR